MFIENVSFANMEKGYHYDPGKEWAWISIVNTDHHFPTPKFTDYSARLQLKFMDTDGDGEGCIQDDQATAIIEFLDEQFKLNRNVLVNCHAGECRSGAVVEAAMLLGFQSTDTPRLPNWYINRKLMQKIIELEDAGKITVRFA